MVIKTPKIVVFYTAHSFGVGFDHETAVSDANPELVGTPANAYIWNNTAGAFEGFQAETGTGNANQNTHLDWNNNDEDKLSMAPMILAQMKVRHPGEDIYLIPLGVFGSTMTKPAVTQAFNNRTVSAVDNTTNGAETRITLNTGAFGALAVDRVGPVEATVAGITGLTPDINATEAAATLMTSGLVVVIPTGTTGTASFGSATVNVDLGHWDSALTDNQAIFPDWVTLVTAAYEAMWAADLAPDPRALFVTLGVNDVTYDLQAGFEVAMLAFVTAARDAIRVREGEDIPIVWLEPIIALANSGAALTRRNTIRTALRTKANADSKFVTLRVDQTDPAVNSPVTLTSDGIHPTYTGFSELSKHLVNALNRIT